jgi:hypothetical protein
LFDRLNDRFSAEDHFHQPAIARHQPSNNLTREMDHLVWNLHSSDLSKNSHCHNHQRYRMWQISIPLSASARSNDSLVSSWLPRKSCDFHDLHRRSFFILVSSFHPVHLIQPEKTSLAKLCATFSPLWPRDWNGHSITRERIRMPTK